MQWCHNCFKTFEVECSLSETSFLDLLLSKLIQSIFVISDNGEYVRIKLQNIRIIKMKYITVWCVQSQYKRSVLGLSRCIHSLQKLVTEDTMFTVKQAGETYTYISHQHIVVLKEVNNISIDIDPYCCRIIIKRVARIAPVTVGHVPRELSRFVFYFIQEGGQVTGTIASTLPRISPIPKGGLELPILMHFTHENKAISSKMEEVAS